jgi:hypothetical protein
MARPPGTAVVLETARKRVAGLRACKTKPTLGAEMSPESVEADMAAIAAKVAARDELKATLDQTSNEIERLVAGLNDKNTRILAGVGAQLGKDSDEYEQVGGTRTSERKRPGPRKPGGSEDPTPPKP